MTDLPDRPDRPDGRSRLPSRRIALGLAAIPLLAALVAEATLIGHHGAHRHRPAPRSTTSTSTQAERQAELARTAAIRRLLAVRSQAVMHHDLAAWMSVIDPSTTPFRHAQRQAFRNLQQVPFASWSYSFSPRQAQSPTARSQRYDVASWAPQTFVLHYRLRGFDTQPTSLQQFPTFVHRGGRWFLASLSDFARQGMHSARDLWDFGPVAVVRTPDVLVLGHPQSLALMREVATEVAADIPRVTAVWGPGWSRRAVVLVPSTETELAAVVQDHGKLDQIAAVATAEVEAGPGKPKPVGDRIGINPQNWSKLSPLGRQIVLTHELTHVATRRVTSAATPKWLAEGFADYVGYLDSGVPTTFVAQELRRDVLAGHGPRSLPADREFDGSSKELSQAYEGAWLACRLIAQRYGQRSLVRFYVAVGRSSETPRLAVAAALEGVLHTSTRQFVAGWRGYLHSELA